MLSNAHKSILNKLINNMVNDPNKILLDEYITLHNITIALYARNVLCIHGNWTKLKKLYQFNYEYVRENNTSYKLTDIENKLRKYCNIFIKNEENFKHFYDEFIDFIKLSLYEMINNIIVPLRIMSPKIKCIIEKYKEFKYIKKSTKINYAVIKQLGIILN